MKLKALLHAAGLACPDHSDTEITGVTSRTDRICPGSLFICIRGLHTDGHDLIGEAIDRGALAILCDRYFVPPQESSVIFVGCADTRAAEAALQNAWYREPARELSLIGVTGTNGKTTVTHMIRRILTNAGHPTGMIGTLGCILPDGERLSAENADPAANMTTPDPAELYSTLRQMADAGAEYVVMEVSSHALALEKLAPLFFSVAIFTNLTPEHLDFHKTMERYADAKAKLFERARLSIVNADSPYAAGILRHAMGNTLTCTAGNADADYCATDVTRAPVGGVEYRLRSLRTRLSLRVPIPGDYTVINSMQAAMCALACGCSPGVVKAALSTMPPVMGRMERVRLGLSADLSVYLDYAHTPDALEQSLMTARTLCVKNGALTVLFGCGGDRDRQKRPLMGELAARLADRVIITSDNSRTEDPDAIIREILEGVRETNAKVLVIPDRETAIRHAVLTAASGDLILLAGKGHEEYEIRGGVRRAFSERRIVLEAFAERMEGQHQNGKGEA